MWLLIAIIGYLLAGLVLMLDKFILTKSVDKPVVYTFYSTIFMLAIFCVLPFSGELLYGYDWLIALLSGLSFGFGLWVMFSAVKEGEASHINPFIGSSVVIFVFFLSRYFLGEKLTDWQTAGLIILIFATLLLSFEKSKRHNGFHFGFVLALLAGLLFAISHVSAKYIYENYSFLTGLIWTKGTIGLVGLFLLIFPAVRKVFSHNKKSKDKDNKHSVAIVVTNKILGVISVLAIQYSIAIGSVIIVNALVGIQYAFLFILIGVLTRFWPRILKEYFTKRELIVELIAIILVIIGLGFIIL